MKNSIPKILFVAEKLTKGYLVDEILNHLDKMLTGEINLTVVGTGEIKDGYNNININYAGYLAEDELVKEYQSTDIFIYPSAADVFGLVLIEAMACGLPIVTFGVDAIPEVVRDSAFLIPPFNTYSFALNVKYLIQCEALRVALGQRGRMITCKLYNIKNVAEVYHSLFEGSIKC